MEGFLAAYLGMMQNFANFKDRTMRNGFWMAFWVNFLIECLLGIFAGFISFFSILISLYSLAIFVPFLALTVRRLRDAGKEWYYVFFYLIPVVGWILLIIFLCQPSTPADDTPVV